jgi:hypothetical protein
MAPATADDGGMRGSRCLCARAGHHAVHITQQLAEEKEVQIALEEERMHACPPACRPA